MNYNSANKLNLNNVTLFCVSNVKHDIQLTVLEHCMEKINFGAVKFITNKDIHHDKITIVNVEELNHIDYPKGWSEFTIYKLQQYIDTDFALHVHNDGFIVNPDSWTDEFLKYDYIGAPWPDKSFIDDFGENIRVGNGGFCLKSKKLLKIFTELNIPWTAYREHWHDDGFISMAHVHELKQNGIKYPDAALAYRFARELPCDDLDNNIKPFGFHGYFPHNKKYPKFY